MNALDIIGKKRQSEFLTDEEIDYFIQGYAQNKIPDYQMSALLMAICLNGMNFAETAALTRSMLLSGIRINLGNIPGKKIDKHSTGGVGDKVSLILAPLVAAAGVKVPMISGRGLSFSGGTLDKLDAIPGFRSNLSVEKFYKQIEDIGVAMVGQTEHIVPADKKMYALRDATSTIDSIPLITASILSKKLAEGIDGLVLDVKTGSGAFMTKLDDSKMLANSMVKTAELENLPTRVLITRMDQPLGYCAGNWLETREAILCLLGEGADDLMHITKTLASHMLHMAHLVESTEEALDSLESLISSGQAFQKFMAMVESQGGDTSFLKNPEKYPPSKIKEYIYASETGYVSDINARIIGFSVVKLGGGRLVMEDQIDYGAGVVLENKVGDFIKKNDRIATIYSERHQSIESVKKDISDAFIITNTPPREQELIINIFQSDGQE